jgi:GntR family transcriptional regulator/MocR family aminotransferase
LPIGRRRQLLAWARQAKALIVEDDYDSEYRYDISPVPPLYGLDDSSNVIYLGTVSKTLSPTLRIGYLVVPHQLQDVFITAKELVDRHTSISEQSAVASMLESGLYESHVRKIRCRNGERRQALLSSLRREFGDRISIAGADAGLHIVIWFHEIAQSVTAELIEQAEALGVGVHSVTPLHDPCVRDDLPEQVGLIMGYAALETRQIEKGVQLLRQALDRLDA